jgi:thiamine-phosphate pyrophosphorylase
LNPDGLRAALRLVLITPGDRAPEATRALVEAALAGGVTCVLLREPQLTRDARACLAQGLTEAAHEAGAALVIHGDPGLAVECGADGVHTGHGGPDVGALRTRAPRRWAGRSAHWPIGAEDRAADYVLLSPFRPTHRSHPRPLLTEQQVRAVLADPGVPPVVALGGLTADTLPELPPGLAGVAVMRAITESADPCAAAQSLVEALGASMGSPRNGAPDAARVRRPPPPGHGQAPEAEASR